MAIKLGEVAPDFKANTTKGEISLSDYKGKWVLLFTFPGAFTSVCSSEIPEFAMKIKEFDKLDTQIIGASGDTVYVLKAWIEDIEDKASIDIDYPIISDVHHNILRAYEVFDEASGFSYRGTFVIDPEGIVRYAQYHPMQFGRNVDEFIRVLKNLQKK